MYIAGTTTVATIFTASIASQVQALLLRQIDVKLPATSDTDRLNRRWRATLKMGSLKDRFRYPLAGSVYLLTSLITTVIVTGLTPDLTTRRSPYSPKISYGPNRCCRTQPLSDVELDGREYYWNLRNGSAFFIPANAGGCPTRFAAVLAGNVNSVNPEVFAYADGGVKVPGSAAGTPNSIYSSRSNIAPSFTSLLGMYGRSVVATTQCVPVMRKNPVSCRRGGTIILGPSHINLTSSDGKCEHNAELPFFNPLTNNTMASTMCAHGEVGQGTIVMGASGEYVKWLASFLGDHDYPQPADGADWAGYSYVVTCSVDARDVWEYRTVTLTLQNPETSDASYARSLQGDEPCYPIPETSAINGCLIGTTAAANWQILAQNSGQDGLLDLLGDLTENWRPPPYGFSNSVNAVEDSLGLISALVASRITSDSTAAVNGTAVITATTVGSRKPFAFVFIFPPIAVALVLLYFIIITPKVKETAEGEFFSSSDIGDIMQMGRIQETNRQKLERQRGTERQREAVTERETETETEAQGERETEQDAEAGQAPQSDRDNLLLFAAPHGQSPDEEQAQ